MAARIQSPVKQRKSLPLTAENEAEIVKVLQTSSYQQALEELSGRKIIDMDLSTAAVMHAIFEVGISAVRQQAEREGYAQIAASMVSLDSREQRKVARRRQPAWSEE